MATFQLAKAAIFGGSIDEAVDLMIHGSKEYREATGRKTTARSPENYIIVDTEDAIVLETSGNHWAIRRPGEFGEKDFVVSTNYQLCEYSYDENDVRTNVPMYDESICERFGGCKEEMSPNLKIKYLLVMIPRNW
jgi:hypothetical protein